MDIYAEITKNDLRDIEEAEEDGSSHILSALPSGATINRKSGSRACYIECDSEDSLDDLVAFLDSRGISWQED